MANCKRCVFAEWDYEEFSNTTEKWWFVDGCIKGCDCDREQCDEFEEVREIED